MTAALRLSGPRDRPLLMSGPLVVKTLADEKWKTRRTRGLEGFTKRGEFAGFVHHDGELYAVFRDSIPDDPVPIEVKCPYGKPGDRLWVKETWRVAAWRDDGRMAVDYRASPDLVRTPWAHPPKEQFKKLTARSDREAERAEQEGRGSCSRGAVRNWVWDHGDSPCRWRPSIHMPRWASRLTLEVTGIRVERVQSISREDALAEGVDLREEKWPDSPQSMPLRLKPEYAFELLWKSINGPDSWAANPWVWVVEFKRVRP